MTETTIDTTSKIDINKKGLIQKILKLNPKEKEHILKIFIAHNIEFTKNINGYFFNLSHVTDEFLTVINNSIVSIEKNRCVLDDIDKNREIMLQQCKDLIENKLNCTKKLKQNEYYKKIKKKDVVSNVQMSYTKVYSDIYNLRKRHTKEIELEKIVYQKNSVFYRLNYVMRMNSRNKTVKPAENPDSNYGYLEEISVQNDDNADIIEEQDMEPEPGLDIDMEPELDHDEPMDLDITDKDINDTSDESDNEDKIFYKQLLNQHGFMFNNDNLCRLVYNKYIE